MKKKLILKHKKSPFFYLTFLKPGYKLIKCLICMKLTYKFGHKSKKIWRVKRAAYNESIIKL